MFGRVAQSWILSHLDMQSEAMCCWVEVHEQDPVSREDLLVQRRGIARSFQTQWVFLILHYTSLGSASRKRHCKAEHKVQQTPCCVSLLWMVPAMPPCGGHLETMISWGMKFVGVGMVFTDVGLIYADIGMVYHPMSRQQTNPICCLHHQNNIWEVFESCQWLTCGKCLDHLCAKIPATLPLTCFFPYIHVFSGLVGLLYARLAQEL